MPRKFVTHDIRFIIFSAFMNETHHKLVVIHKKCVKSGICENKDFDQMHLFAKKKLMFCLNATERIKSYKKIFEYVSMVISRFVISRSKCLNSLHLIIILH